MILTVIKSIFPPADDSAFCLVSCTIVSDVLSLVWYPKESFKAILNNWIKWDCEEHIWSTYGSCLALVLRKLYNRSVFVLMRHKQLCNVEENLERNSEIVKGILNWLKTHINQDSFRFHIQISANVYI